MKKKSILLVTKIVIIFILASVVLIRLANKINFDSIFIQSLESKTNTGDPVFNKISWFSYSDKDVWMMNQSHHGADAKGENLDRLAIIVDKTTSPNNIRFLQLKPGNLVWSEDLIQQRIPNKVSCFLCHANGPRAIRADYKGVVNNTFLDKLKISYLNMKIKKYGKLVENSAHIIEDKSLKIPFRYPGKLDNDLLLVKSCKKCHNDSKDGRGYLKRQNFLAIKFLIENKFMPPSGHSIPAIEQQKIQKFLTGL